MSLIRHTIFFICKFLFPLLYIINMIHKEEESIFRIQMHIRRLWNDLISLIFARFPQKHIKTYYKKDRTLLNDSLFHILGHSI